MLTRATALSVFSFGGNLGFACGPITVTLVANALGISGVGLFILVGGGVALLLAHYFPAMRRQSAQHWQQKRQRESGSPVPVKDDWRHFAILACVLFGRSIIFYGLNTFLVLYWMHILKQSNTSGSLALSVLFIVGATRTIIGGHLVDHIGAVKTIRFAFTIMPFLLLAFSLTKSVIVASALLLPIGMLIFIPYSAIVLLGQRYLPNQMGLASGVTLGLAISIGGIATPFLGQVADATSLITVFFILTAVALIPMGAAYFIIEPTIK
ncbi:MFS transporter [Limosilactobacillus fermentum]|uniref:MFS transporter n=1 Tax=Limosilactobacillus fermentum TaxID=1613 RepID=UPI000E0BEA7A|nr:MFS transporter [Limosilactobacillus fermentum]AXH07556.1 MFS transporter [Limosilactobacillus fermentum]MDR7662644.1 MFS transporter [Limosilactobacillus fermentum]